MLSLLTKLKDNISDTSLSIDALVFTNCVYFYFFDLILILFFGIFFQVICFSNKCNCFQIIGFHLFMYLYIVYSSSVLEGGVLFVIFTICVGAHLRK